METWKTKDGKTIETARSRSHQILVRLSEEELAQFRKLVEASGLSQQEYVRRAVLGATITNTDGLRELLPEMKRQGNNLNQIARALNGMGHVSPRVLDDTMREVQEAWLSLKLYLQKAR